MKTLNKILFLLLMLYFVACSEESSRFPITNDGIQPVAIKSSDITVKSTNGGAVIKYKLPDAPNLGAVEAQYTLSTGQEFKVRTSFLADSIVVEGFSDTEEYDVNLFVVDRSENYSPATLVKIKPNKSPLQNVFESVEVTAVFGGMQITWENNDETPIGIFVSKIDGVDTTELDSYYSDTKDGGFLIRGLDTIPVNGFLKVRDKWQNYSEAYDIDGVKPLYEIEIKKDRIEPMSNVHFFSLGPESPSNIMNLFDAVKVIYPIFPTNAIVPWYGSIKLDSRIKLSRIVLWQYAWVPYKDILYAGGNARIVNFYGTNDPNPLGDSDGEIDESWEFIMECEIIKPSGPPFIGHNQTEEDMDQAENRGHAFDVPSHIKPYKYLRFQTIQTFGGSSQHGAMSEIQIFGNDNF